MIKRRIAIFLYIPAEAIRSIYFFLDRTILGYRRKRGSLPRTLNSISGAAAVRAAFDFEHRSELSDIYKAIDDAIAHVISADSRLNSSPTLEHSRHAMALAMIQKAINDLIASLELMRLGYLSNSMSGLRTALESHSMATLIILDKNIAKQFVENRFSTNSAFSKSIERKELNLPAETKTHLKSLYATLSSMTHPSWESVRTHLVSNKGEFSVGGSYDSRKTQIYNQLAANIRIAAENISHSLKSAYGID